MKKKILILNLFIFFSCNSPQKKDPILINALTNIKIVTRGQIHKIDNEYRLDYYDVYEKDTHMIFLEKKGFQAGGPSWLGIIYGAIKLSDENILNEIRFDDESDGIAIWSNNKKTLEKIGRLISIIKSNEKLLLKSIAVAEKNWKME